MRTADTKSPSAREVAERIARDVLVGDWEGDGIEDHVRRVESALLSFAQSARQEQREEDAKIAENRAEVPRRIRELDREAGLNRATDTNVSVIQACDDIARSIRGSK